MNSSIKKSPNRKFFAPPAAELVCYKTIMKNDRLILDGEPLIEIDLIEEDLNRAPADQAGPTKSTRIPLTRVPVQRTRSPWLRALWMLIVMLAIFSGLLAYAIYGGRAGDKSLARLEAVELRLEQLESRLRAVESQQKP